MSYKIKINDFEGPLDLLFHLIDKNKLDIYDIPISSITQQYLEYLYSSNYLDLNNASEFLLMAATLLEIKSKTLLPDSDLANKQLTIEDALDPRAELINRLLEYKKYKLAAESLKSNEIIHELVYFKEAEILKEAENGENVLEGISLDDIFKAFSKIINKEEEEVKDISIKILRDEISVSERMREIKDLLKTKTAMKFSDFFSVHRHKDYKIVTFLAILELIKVKRINIKQDSTFSEIYIITRKKQDQDKNED
jgi:segregation and condensation protein A